MEDKRKGTDRAFIVYIVILFLWNAGILFAPFAAHLGMNDMASFLYNFYSFDHQWIYRSTCIFSDWTIGDCIEDGEEVYTVYTNNGVMLWEGSFEYDKEQIGLNKAEKVIRDGVIGYKFAVDTRDVGFYLTMFLGGLVAEKTGWTKKKELPSRLYIFLAVLFIGLDGGGQLFDLWESTNTIRIITGFFGGFVIPFYLFPILNALRGQRAQRGFVFLQ